MSEDQRREKAGDAQQDPCGNLIDGCREQWALDASASCLESEWQTMPDLSEESLVVARKIISFQRLQCAEFLRNRRISSLRGFKCN